MGCDTFCKISEIESSDFLNLIKFDVKFLKFRLISSEVHATIISNHDLVNHDLAFRRCNYVYRQRSGTGVPAKQV